MPKRFKTLNAALTYLRPTSGGDDAAVPDAPAGTALKKYQDYRSGKVRLGYTRANASLPGETKIISLRPFAFDKESAVKVTTTVSTRSFGNIGEFGLTLAKLGLDEVSAANAIDMEGFQPARAICRRTTGTTATTKTSKITARPYKSKAAASSTLPIGRTADKSSWGEQKAAIATDVKAASGVTSVTFKPEVY